MIENAKPVLREEQNVVSTWTSTNILESRMVIEERTAHMLYAPLLTIYDQVILSQSAHHYLASTKEASTKRVSLSINVFLQLHS